MPHPRPVLLWTVVAWNLASAVCAAKEASIVVNGNVLSLSQFNKEILIARDRYARADAGERDALLRALEQLVKERAVLLAATLPVNPQILLDVAFPPGTADTMPAPLREEFERPVSVEGVMESARGAPVLKTFPFELRDRQGRRWRLAPAGALPAVTPEATVSLSGLQLKDAIIFKGADLRSVSRSGLDTEPPKAEITEPRHGAVVRGVVTVRVSASDNQAVRQVQLRKDGALAGTDLDAPYAFTWDTATEADGPHTLAAHAHDADMNLGTSPVITVTVDNTAPHIQIKTPEPGTPLSGVVPMQADAGDAVGLESVKFLVDGLAVGIAVDPPYQISWDSDTVANGPHTVEGLATDRAHNLAKTGEVPVRVLNENHPPQLIPTGNKAVQEGVTLAFTVKALDRDGTKDPLIYRIIDAPPWVHFDSSTGQLYGTPDFTEASVAHPTKVYDHVRLEACDAQPLCDHEDIAISVINVNRPPVMEPLPAPSVSEGTLLTIKPVVTDPDGEPFTCAAAGVPAWMRFDAASCSASGTPPSDLVGHAEGRKRFGIRFQACDANQACDQQSVIVTVLNDNRRPVLDRIGDRDIDELKSLKLDIRASDPDKELIGLTAAPLPPGAVFTETGAGTATVTWTPRADQAGSYAMTVQATDGTLSDAETVRIRVRETHLAISGTIRTDIGTRAEGASVEVSIGNTRKALVITDSRGYYIATDLPPGTYEIRPNEKFSNLPSNHAIHFGPLSRQVELTDHDQRDMDFTSYLKTR